MTSKNLLSYFFLLFRIHLSFYRISFEQNVLVRSCGKKKKLKYLGADAERADAERGV